MAATLVIGRARFRARRTWLRCSRIRSRVGGPMGSVGDHGRSVPVWIALVRLRRDGRAPEFGVSRPDEARLYRNSVVCFVGALAAVWAPRRGTGHSGSRVHGLPHRRPWLRSSRPRSLLPEAKGRRSRLGANVLPTARRDRAQSSRWNPQASALRTLIVPFSSSPGSWEACRGPSSGWAAERSWTCRLIESCSRVRSCPACSTCSRWPRP